MTEEIKRVLTNADSVLSAIYHRGGYAIPWNDIGGEGFRTTVYTVLGDLRSASTSQNRIQPPIDKRSAGLYEKFTVRRTDGTDEPGQKHEGCSYFVLDTKHDRHAVPALLAYADSCESEYPLLAKDIRSIAATLQSEASTAGTPHGNPSSGNLDSCQIDSD